MARAKKAKTKKKARAQAETEPKQEVDAVKGFIIVMVLLIVALGVFIFITTGKLDDYEKSIALAKTFTQGNARRGDPGFGNTALEIQAYLKLMSESGDTLLIDNPQSFFARSYGRSEVGIADSKVGTSARRESVNRRGRYTDFSWVLTIRDIDRRQAALFLYDLESRSPKARTLDLSMRRNTKKGEQSWDGNFRIGYRVAAATR